jgi:hypothetical protein
MHEAARRPIFASPDALNEERAAMAREIHIRHSFDNGSAP